jgi:hypothetical protein
MDGVLNPNDSDCALQFNSHRALYDVLVIGNKAPFRADSKIRVIDLNVSL